ncbi:hypothetical protein IV203_026715 [Nitzschia inconspicua]|uniref:Uncharacterized protein n=1 Tax=Nitzschia inconspicua TaxID=303405 RepID=A0A9K3PXL8_9STRA|nr:hypothetical protein IV203_026715 [Nitzschia inconspicua]
MDGESNSNHNSTTPKQGGGGIGRDVFDDSRRAAFNLSASRRASLGLDFGDALLRRPSGFAEVEFAMQRRRGSMDSVLDAAINDLTRRRLSMAMGLPSDGYGGMSDPLSSIGGMNSMMMSSMGGMPMTNPSATASTAVNSINARQQQLQEQQRELERRQRELELQRQQLLTAMEERRRVMQHMQTKMEDPSSALGNNGMGNSTFGQRNSLLGNLGGGMAGGGLMGMGGNGSGTSSAMAAALMGQSNSGGGARGATGGGGSNEWYVCKICNSKAFANREEAYAHESICMQTAFGASFRRNSGMHDARRGSLDLLGALAGATPNLVSGFQSERRMSIAGESNLSNTTRLMSNGPFSMMEKPLPLAMASDKEWLTPLHCFVRKHCVEIFTASDDDVATPSKGKRKPIMVGQVGIRCPHCHSQDAARSRERGSVYYPTSIASIYNATMNLLQRHLHNCTAVPEDMMKRYETLKADDARSGTSKKYWVESALSLGLVDTANGIRYSALPPPPLPSLTPQQKAREGFSLADGNDDDFFNTSSNALSTLSQRGELDELDSAAKGDMDKISESTKIPADTSRSLVAASDKGGAGNDIPVAEQSLTHSAPLVTADDEPYATGFSFHLLSQMQPCVFTEADRLGKRKGLPPGFPGLACRHCFGGYGSGRFFPSSIKTLSDTSKTLNVLHNHMQRCRKCPVEVRETLDRLRKFHDEERAKMKFGSQKAFFARIWDRLHSNDPTVNSKRKYEQPSRNNAVNTTSASAVAAATSQGMGFPPSMAASFPQSGSFMGGSGAFGAMTGLSGFSAGLGAAGLGTGLTFDSLPIQYTASDMFDSNKRRKLQADNHSSV